METAEIPSELWTELQDKFFQDSSIVTLSNDQVFSDQPWIEKPRLMLFRKRSSQVGYIITLALPFDSLQGKSGSSLINLAVQELEKGGFPHILKQLVRSSPPTNMQQRPYYIHRATISDPIQIPSKIDINTDEYPIKFQPSWSSGRVVLVGDAAHGMPPFTAQGANQGLEDALAIATIIANIALENNWDDKQAIAIAFEKYEHLRRPFVTYVQKATLTGFPHSSNEKWQEYQQKVYCRNFDQVVEALL